MLTSSAPLSRIDMNCTCSPEHMQHLLLTLVAVVDLAHLPDVARHATASERMESLAAADNGGHARGCTGDDRF